MSSLRLCVLCLSAVGLLLLAGVSAADTQDGANPGDRINLSSGAAPMLTGRLTGTAIDADGQPVAGLWVSAGDADDLTACGQASHGAETLADGSYGIDLPPGTYFVYVNSHDQPGHHVPELYQDVNSWSQLEAATRITVDANQLVPGLNLSLPAGHTVTGRLVDGGGQPVTDAGGNIRDAMQDLEYGCALGFGSGGDGRFRVNLPAGTYDLSFGKGSEGHIVRYGIEVTGDLDLGDVLFASAPEPPPVFDPQVLEPDYQVETLVPGGPNTPSDVAVLPDGSVYLAAIRSWTVYEVGAGGTLTSFAPLGVYSLDAGSDGNLYGYMFPGEKGRVYRIDTQGDVTEVGRVPGTSCESTMAVAPGLDLWIGLNECGGTTMDNATLYRMTQAGQLFTVTADLPFGIGGLAFDSGGQLYMTHEHSLYRVNKSDGSRTLLAELPGPVSFHGLVLDPAGNCYVSSSDPVQGDRVFKVTPGGQASTLARLPAGCLQGLARLPDGDLLGTMRCSGALYQIHADGTWDTVLPGNGMATPQAMAFNLKGELLVVNDESGRIVRIQDGRGELFAEVVTYISPLAYMAFRPSGSFYFSEAAPGFTPRLVSVSPNGQVTEVTTDPGWPSGLAFGPDGTLYLAEYMSGEISSLGADGTLTTFATGLTRPQSLVSDGGGKLYVASEGCAPEGDGYNGTNCIVQIDTHGQRTTFAELGAGGLAFSPGGDLYVTSLVGNQTGIVRVAPDGTATTFASGFLVATGLAFDLAGNLYVSDDQNNSITRIAGFPQGSIQGAVRDAETGQPIEDARLSVVTGYPVVLGAEVTSSTGGGYSLPAAPGTFTITASALGYLAATRQVVVDADQVTTVDLALKPGWVIYLPVVTRHSPSGSFLEGDR